MFWPEISEEIPKIETLYEDTTFHYNKLAALLASKVYYHLSEFRESLNYALCAEELFDVNAQNEHVETINAKCIDEYIAIKQKNYLQKSTEGIVDFNNFSRLEQVVNRMFEKCFEHQQNKQALGIGLESHRLDMFERAIQTAHDKEEMLQYAFKVSLTLVCNKSFRNQILQKLVRLYMTLPSPDYISMCQCLIFLDDFQKTAEILEKLIIESDDTSVMAYQLAFDMYENATQQYMLKVRSALQQLKHYARLFFAEKKKVDKESKDTDEVVMEQVTEEVAPEVVVQLTKEEKAIKTRFEHLNSILTGEKVIELHLQFLIRNNNTDLKILDKIKVDVRHSVTHNATVIANGLMHFGTTSDQFLRENLDWLGRAVNWAKFTATSTLGVIHKGHEKEALKLMSAYLPKENSTSTPGSMYTEGGGLYALGLMHANHGGLDMTEYLLRKLRDATAEPVRHGGCLGLGLAAMGTERMDVYEQIKSNLYQDDAITGEAAGIGMGLVMLGSGSSEVINDMLSYAKDTAHEKITRGLALGVALTMYGKQEDADVLIDQLLAEKFPILRWCGMATVAMAYCGTGDNNAVRRLLHAAVSDTNDDVRRWAVTALGFVLFKSPEQVPSLVSLLSESYNPHVRYGAAMAVGIGCAGTALKEAIAVVDPLLEDPVAFVRQGALVAMAMLLMQQTKVTLPKSADFREKIFKIIADRHEDLMTKYGAILAMGIMDAGGRNVTISLQTRTGNANMTAAVGLLVFQNYWFWYPLTNFISLSFTLTCVVVLNKELKMPKLEIKSRARPSTFTYPEPIQIEKEKKKEKVETAVLSVTARQQKKKDAEKNKAKPEPMVLDHVQTKVASSTEKVEVVESDFTILSNPARVIPAQLRVIELASVDSTGEARRYVPVKSIEHGGILVARDCQPNRPSEIVETVKPSLHRDDEADDDDGLVEPEAPEPFLFEDDIVESEPMDTTANDNNSLKQEERNDDDISKPE